MMMIATMGSVSQFDHRHSLESYHEQQQQRADLVALLKECADHLETTGGFSPVIHQTLGALHEHTGRQIALLQSQCQSLETPQQQHKQQEEPQRPASSILEEESGSRSNGSFQQQEEDSSYSQLATKYYATAPTIIESQPTPITPPSSPPKSSLHSLKNQELEDKVQQAPSLRYRHPGIIPEHAVVMVVNNDDDDEPRVVETMSSLQKKQKTTIHMTTTSTARLEEKRRRREEKFLCLQACVAKLIMSQQKRRRSRSSSTSEREEAREEEEEAAADVKNTTAANEQPLAPTEQKVADQEGFNSNITCSASISPKKENLPKEDPPGGEPLKEEEEEEVTLLFDDSVSSNDTNQEPEELPVVAQEEDDDDDDNADEEQPIESIGQQVTDHCQKDPEDMDNADIRSFPKEDPPGDDPLKENIILPSNNASDSNIDTKDLPEGSTAAQEEVIAYDEIMTTDGQPLVVEPTEPQVIDRFQKGLDEDTVKICSAPKQDPPEENPSREDPPAQNPPQKDLPKELIIVSLNSPESNSVTKEQSGRFSVAQEEEEAEAEHVNNKITDGKEQPLESTEQQGTDRCQDPEDTTEPCSFPREDPSNEEEDIIASFNALESNNDTTEQADGRLVAQEEEEEEEEGAINSNSAADEPALEPPEQKVTDRRHEGPENNANSYSASREKLPSENPLKEDLSEEDPLNEAVSMPPNASDLTSDTKERFEGLSVAAQEAGNMNHETAAEEQPLEPTKQQVIDRCQESLEGDAEICPSSMEDPPKEDSPKEGPRNEDISVPSNASDSNNDTKEQPEGEEDAINNAVICPALSENASKEESSKEETGVPSNASDLNTDTKVRPGGSSVAQQRNKDNKIWNFYVPTHPVEQPRDDSQQKTANSAEPVDVASATTINQVGAVDNEDTTALQASTGPQTADQPDDTDSTVEAGTSKWNSGEQEQGVPTISESMDSLEQNLQNDQEIQANHTMDDSTEATPTISNTTGDASVGPKTTRTISPILPVRNNSFGGLFSSLFDRAEAEDNDEEACELRAMPPHVTAFFGEDDCEKGAVEVVLDLEEGMEESAVMEMDDEDDTEGRILKLDENTADETVIKTEEHVGDQHAIEKESAVDEKFVLGLEDCASDQRVLEMKPDATEDPVLGLEECTAKTSVSGMKSDTEKEPALEREPNFAEEPIFGEACGVAEGSFLETESDNTEEHTTLELAGSATEISDLEIESETADELAVCESTEEKHILGVGADNAKGGVLGCEEVVTAKHILETEPTLTKEPILGDTDDATENRVLAIKADVAHEPILWCCEHATEKHAVDVEPESSILEWGDPVTAAKDADIAEEPILGCEEHATEKLVVENEFGIVDEPVLGSEEGASEKHALEIKSDIAEEPVFGCGEYVTEEHALEKEADIAEEEPILHRGERMFLEIEADIDENSVSRCEENTTGKLFLEMGPDMSEDSIWGCEEYAAENHSFEVDPVIAEESVLEFKEHVEEKHFLQGDSDIVEEAILGWGEYAAEHQVLEIDPNVTEEPVQVWGEQATEKHFVKVDPSTIDEPVLEYEEHPAGTHVLETEPDMAEEQANSVWGKYAAEEHVLEVEPDIAEQLDWGLWRYATGESSLEVEPGDEDAILGWGECATERPILDTDTEHDIDEKLALELENEVVLQGLTSASTTSSGHSMSSSGSSSNYGSAPRSRSGSAQSSSSRSTMEGYSDYDDDDRLFYVDKSHRKQAKDRELYNEAGKHDLTSSTTSSHPSSCSSGSASSSWSHISPPSSHSGSAQSSPSRRSMRDDSNDYDDVATPDKLFCVDESDDRKQQAKDGMDWMSSEGEGPIVTDTEDEEEEEEEVETSFEASGHSVYSDDPMDDDMYLDWLFQSAVGEFE